MTKSIYLLGGAGSGKSTFMAALMDHLPPLGEQRDIWCKRNAKETLVTLRGHYFGDDGIYLGKMRGEFPGTDGLDRASGFVGEAWLENDSFALTPYILGEGSTLSTNGFIGALRSHTDLLLVHLWAEPFVLELRFLARGSAQNSGWVKTSITRARNLSTAFGGLDVNTADPAAYKLALAACLTHLKGTDRG